jgi:predicted anti-sigma-YlaC factor YlaD
MMNCEEMSMKMSAYLDREVSVQETEEIEEHLKFCSSCREKLSEFSRLEEFRSLLAPEQVSEEQWSQCWESIKNRTTDALASGYEEKTLSEERSAKAGRRVARVALYSVLAAAAACVALAVSGHLTTLLTTAPKEPQEASIIINDYDDSQYTLLIEDKPDFVIIRLTPVVE